MFDTAAQIGFAIALILPGFLVVQLSERRRPSTPAGGDLELILRGLVYALIIQSVGALTGWLPDLVDDLQAGEPQSHLDAAALYGLLVCVALPTVIGLALGSILAGAESRGSLKWWHYALGGRDARRAWDYTFCRNNGAWMRVFLKDQPKGLPVAVLGKYGTGSWASQSPADCDLYLEQFWPTKENGAVDPDDFKNGSHGKIYLSGEQIARIEVLT